VNTVTSAGLSESEAEATVPIVASGAATAAVDAEIAVSRSETSTAKVTEGDVFPRPLAADDEPAEQTPTAATATSTFIAAADCSPALNGNQPVGADVCEEVEKILLAKTPDASPTSTQKAIAGAEASAATVQLLPQTTLRP